MTDCPTCGYQIDKVERMRTEIDRLHAQRESSDRVIRVQHDEIDRLRTEVERLRAERAGILEGLKDRIETRLNDCLCEMKEGYDDSIVGFNEAWDIMRKVFEDEARRTLEGT